VKIELDESSATVSGDLDTFVLADAEAALEKRGFPAEKAERLSGS